MYRATNDIFNKAQAQAASDEEKYNKKNNITNSDTQKKTIKNDLNEEIKKNDNNDNEPMNESIDEYELLNKTTKIGSGAFEVSCSFLELYNDEIKDLLYFDSDVNDNNSVNTCSLDSNNENISNNNANTNTYIYATPNKQINTNNNKNNNSNNNNNNDNNNNNNSIVNTPTFYTPTTNMSVKGSASKHNKGIQICEDHTGVYLSNIKKVSVTDINQVLKVLKVGM